MESLQPTYLAPPPAQGLAVSSEEEEEEEGAHLSSLLNQPGAPGVFSHQVSPQHNSLVVSSLPANPPPPLSLEVCSEVARAAQLQRATPSLVRPPSALYSRLSSGEGEELRPLPQHQSLKPRAPSDSPASLCLEDPPPPLPTSLCLLPTRRPPHPRPASNQWDLPQCLELSQQPLNLPAVSGV